MKKILLIDDDEATNFLHKMVIDSAGCTDEVVVMTRAEEALAYLRSGAIGAHPQPEVIFLDINMPGMDGWEFIAEYQLLPDSMKSEIIVVMLTTSLNPDDVARGEGDHAVQSFMTKPLTLEGLAQVLGD